MPSKHIEPYLPLLQVIWDIPYARIVDYATALHTTVKQVRRDLRQLEAWRLIVHNPPRQMPVYRLPTAEESEHCKDCSQPITADNLLLKFQFGKLYPRRTLCLHCATQRARPHALKWQRDHSQQHTENVRRHRFHSVIGKGNLQWQSQD